MNKARLQRSLLRDADPRKVQYHCLTQDAPCFSARHGNIYRDPVGVGATRFFSGFYGVLRRSIPTRNFQRKPTTTPEPLEFIHKCHIDQTMARLPTCYLSKAKVNKPIFRPSVFSEFCYQRMIPFRPMPAL